MNSTSFTCVNNCKICDLYGAIWDFMQTCLIGNTAFESKNRLLGRAKQSLRRSEQSFRRSEQTLLRSEQLKPDEAVIHHLGSKCNLVNLKLHVDSSYNYRFSVRKLTKQSNSTRYRRDHELSRLPLKKIILAIHAKKFLVLLLNHYFS